MDYIVVDCPHCKDSIIIYKNEINCRIFRHAVYKNSGQPVPPHLSKEECDRLFSTNEIYGCCKPFKLNENDVPEICGYI